MRTTLALMLRAAGYDVEDCGSGAEGCELAKSGAYDLVITDLRMGAVTGLDVLRAAREGPLPTEVMVMTAYGTIESAVEAMRLGAHDYLQKPFSEQELLMKVERALNSRRLKGQVQLLATEFKERYGFDNIVGRSSAIRAVLGRILRIAPTKATVLITGESGTGKELVAKAIHANSKRAEKPFVPINCAAINETLLESELFGHVRGAFTGAVAARKGLFEEADGGTFFFDEIAETSMAFQAKLLRLIESSDVRRVGENSSVQVDVRIVAATNQDLRLSVKEKRFRGDLYYRLNVARFRLPPLRERKEDIPMLAEFFVDKHNRRHGKSVSMAHQVAMQLVDRSFPGNVRELENLIEQAVAFADDGVIRLEDLQSADSMPMTPPMARTLAEVVEAAEREAIETALHEARGNRERAAAALGVSATTLWRKITRLGIDPAPRGNDGF